MENNENKFVHLHLHTEYSLLDGATRISKLFDKVYEKGMNAVAITDHGNMYATYHFFKTAQGRYKSLVEKLGKEEADKRYVKPIIGCEFYVADNMFSRAGRQDRDNHHLVLLAKNEVGYKNLVLLDSAAFIDGFYYRPRIDFDLLSKHADGLICLSACLAGEIPQLLLQNRDIDAEKVALKYKQLFGEDYYIEIQDHGITDERVVNPKLVDIARRNNIPLVATNDVHYLNRSDSEMHDALLCIQTGSYLDEPNRMRFEGTEFYLKDYEEMYDLFKYAPEALENTTKIAEKCNVVFDTSKKLPPYHPPDGSTPLEFLKKLIKEGIADKYGTPPPPEVTERADYELNIIAEMGYVEYYLIVWDFIHYAEQNGIAVGPGRGSGAGSIIAYSIGITKVEPLRYNLLFERFLNPDRGSMPDFDIDFCMDRRSEVIDYVIRKYGKDKVSQIITFGTMATKNAIKDIARIKRVPYAEVDKVTKLIPNMLKANLEQILGLSKGKNGEDLSIQEVIDIYENNPELRDVMNLAMQVEGSPRQPGTHAAGVVICRDPLLQHVPLQRNGDAETGIVTTQFNMSEVEELGLLKIDFLGLTNLTDIDKTVRMVKQTRGIDVDISKLTYDDPKVYELISSGDTGAVFQLESAGMTRLMKDLQPSCLEDIIAGISLFRPGPMQFIPEFIKGKKNKDGVIYKHPLLEKVLSTTYGCMVYQEQIMSLARELAGYSYGTADLLRYAMGKKKMGEMAKHREWFLHGGEIETRRGVVKVEGAVARGIPEELAAELYGQMSEFANYAFNKPHAAGYAYIAYQTAFLKLNYFPEFITSVMNNRLNKPDEVKKYVAYAQERGLQVLQPDINKSESGFSVENGNIRFGVGAIKSIGAGNIEKVIEERKLNGEFTSLEDFLMRAGALNRRMIENLIKGGAFDCFGLARAEMMAKFEPLQERIAADKKKREEGQYSFWDIMGEQMPIVKDDFGDIKEYPQKYKLSLEKEVLGMCISGNPLMEYADRLRGFDFNTSLIMVEEGDEEAKQSLLNEFNNKKVTLGGNLFECERRTTKSNKQMAVARLEDLYGTVELLLFSRSLQSNKNFLVDDTMVTVTGTLHLDDASPRIFVDTIEPWQEQTQNVEYSPTILYLRMDKQDDDIYAKVADVLTDYEGENTVMIVIAGQRFYMPYHVRECNGIVYELTNILGEGNVAFAKRSKNGASK